MKMKEQTHLYDIVVQLIYVRKATNIFLKTGKQECNRNPPNDGDINEINTHQTKPQGTQNQEKNVSLSTFRKTAVYIGKTACVINIWKKDVASKKVNDGGKTNNY